MSVYTSALHMCMHNINASTDQLGEVVGLPMMRFLAVPVGLYRVT